MGEWDTSKLAIPCRCKQSLPDLRRITFWPLGQSLLIEHYDMSALGHDPRMEGGKEGKREE